MTPLLEGNAVRPSRAREDESAVRSDDASRFPLFWRVRLIRPEWFGRRCRIVIHGRRGNRLIEFDNGDRVVCPGAYLRRSPA